MIRNSHRELLETIFNFSLSKNTLPLFNSEGNPTLTSQISSEGMSEFDLDEDFSLSDDEQEEPVVNFDELD